MKGTTPMKLKLVLKVKINKTTHILFKEWTDVTKSPFFKKLPLTGGIGSNPVTTGWLVTVGEFRKFPICKDSSGEWSIDFIANGADNIHYPDKTVVVANFYEIYCDEVIQNKIGIKLLEFLTKQGAFELE